MAVDTPATIAILGAGPIGLETALYARFLGYEVILFERGTVAENVRQWGHVRMFSPFSMNRSSLGLAALAAQDNEYQPPDETALLTGDQWREQYLLPLSRTDLLADHIHTQCRVISVARDEFLKRDPPGAAPRQEVDFRILIERDNQQQENIRADVVIDTTGVFGNPNWMGAGGGPAAGESRCRSRIWYQLPDVAGRHRERFADRRVLVVGNGYSAATAIVALAELKVAHPQTEIFWVTRGNVASGKGPVPVLDEDRLAERARLGAEANRCARGGAVTHWPATCVDQLSHDSAEGRFHVSLGGDDPRTVEVDEIIANVGYRPDDTLYEELQIHQCYCTQGPMKLAAKLLQHASPDCLDQPATGPETLINPEPDFYILGAKSYGRNPHFLVANGLQQVRDVFSLIGDRADLDLYQNATSLP